MEIECKASLALCAVGIGKEGPVPMSVVNGFFAPETLPRALVFRKVP